MEKPDSKELFRVKNVADRLSVCERTIRRAIADGKIKVIRLGSSVLIPRQEVERLITRGF